MLPFLGPLLSGLKTGAAPALFKLGATVSQELPDVYGGVSKEGPKKPSFFKDLLKNRLNEGTQMLLQNALGQNPNSGMRALGQGLENGMTRMGSMAIPQVQGSNVPLGYMNFARPSVPNRYR